MHDKFFCSTEEYYSWIVYQQLSGTIAIYQANISLDMDMFPAPSVDIFRGVFEAVILLFPVSQVSRFMWLRWFIWIALPHA